MEYDIIFLEMEPSEAIKNYVEKYIEKFQKYLHRENSDAVFIHVVLDGKFNHHMMSVEVRVKSNHFNLIMKKEGHDMYPLIDETMKAMENELQKKKEKIIDDLRKRTPLKKDF
jgi:putative sigma-54 modulation protein